MGTETLQPGPDGTAVPSECDVIRMANQPDLTKLSPAALQKVQDGKGLPDFFILSSEDKAHHPPRLSVWVVGLTTELEAWVLVGASPKRTWVLKLSVRAIQAIQAASRDNLPETPALEVHWERATRLLPDGTRVPETRPGWQGHAGIANLEHGNKHQKAALRLALADLVKIRILTENEVSDALRQMENAPPTISRPQQEH